MFFQSKHRIINHGGRDHEKSEKHHGERTSGKFHCKKDEFTDMPRTQTEKGELANEQVLRSSKI